MIGAVRSWPWRPALAVLLPLLAVVGVGAANGGFFATAFGWTALAFAWVVVIAITVVVPAWGRFDRVWLAVAACLSVYTFASAAWAGSAGDAVNGGLRTLVYLTGIAGALVVLRRGKITYWLSGLVLGVAGVCIYSLATRLFPTHFGGINTSDYRLFVPVGYWNALGIFAGIALLLGFGVAAAGRGTALRILSAVALLALAPTLYFTFSRGAWIALIIGALAMFALSPQRLRLVTAAAVLGAAPAVGVLLASRSVALTHSTATLAAASDAGRKLALELALLALVQAVLAAAYVVFSERIRLARVGRRAYAAVLVLVAAGALALTFVAYGSPATIARHAYHSFVSAPTGGTNLNSRLFTLSNNGRTVLWHAAWHEFEAHPLAGSGAGSFGRWWLAHRKTSYFVQDAHNLYVQTLGELGVIGIALLALLLGLPLVAAVRARGHPLVAPAFGGFVAYLVHASVDWDWQMPAVTLLALFVGAAILAAARRDDPERRPLGGRARIAFGTGAVAAAAVAFVGLIGNIALARSDGAIANALGRKAAAQAAIARRWAPWSAQALKDLGDGRLLLGEKRAGLAALRDAAAKDPGNWEIWFDIAAGTTGSAHQAALARATALNPQSPEIADVERLAAAKAG
jgi:hypothetical protein